MKNNLLLLPIFSLLIFTMTYGQETVVEKGLQSITSDAIKAQLGFLSSDWTEGREAGEKGAYLASDYIASMLQLYGVKPGGDFLQANGYPAVFTDNGRSYFQNFVLLRTSPGDEQTFVVKTVTGNATRTVDYDFNIDFTCQVPEIAIEVEAPVIFAGYGFKNEKIGFNDFSKVDVKGKFILKITGSPAIARESLTPSEISNSFRDADNLLREKGALGIIEFSPNLTTAGNPPLRDFLNPSPSEYRPSTGRQDAKYSMPGRKTNNDLIRVRVSARIADEILQGTGISSDDYLKKADSNIPYTAPQMSGKIVSLKTTVNTSLVAVRNVIGIIEGNNTDQVIVLGAHYDHTGIGNGYIWNGADDNASGTVGVITLAKAIMATGKKPEKTIVIALWTAEEEGLFGSHYYVDHLPYPLKNLRLNANFDMISRYISEDNRTGVVMTYTKSFPQFKDITEANIKRYGIDLKVDYQPSDNPAGGSDHRSFVEAGVPIIRFKPGHREEYHTPFDEINTVDWDIMEKIIRISFTDIWELANSSW